MMWRNWNNLKYIVSVITQYIVGLLAVHADRNQNVTIKAMWERVAKKKHNTQGLLKLSMGYGGIVMGLSVIQQNINQYALYPFMVNYPYLTVTYHMLYCCTIRLKMQRNG